MRLKAKTVVIGKQKQPEPWPLERARLINRHNEAMNDERRHARSQRTTAYQEGREEALQQFAAKADMMEYFFQSAARELGHGIGAQLRETLDAYDPIFQEKKRISDAVLNAAQLSVRVSDVLSADASNMIVNTIEIKPMRFNVAFKIPLRV